MLALRVLVVVVVQCVVAVGGEEMAPPRSASALRLWAHRHRLLLGQELDTHRFGSAPVTWNNKIKYKIK